MGVVQLLSPLDSRAILFSANKALPAFCVAKEKRSRFKTNPTQQLKDTLLRCHLPLLSGKISLHLLLGQILSLQLPRLKRSHPWVGNGRLTGDPFPGEHSLVSDKWIGRHRCRWHMVINHLGSFSSKELIKFLASSVISSKLSSSNSHWAAVTKARVSASSLPWKGDSPLSLKGMKDNKVQNASIRIRSAKRLQSELVTRQRRHNVGSFQFYFFWEEKLRNIWQQLKSCSLIIFHWQRITIWLHCTHKM